MAYMVKIEDIEELMGEIEKRLYACGHHGAVSILRHAASQPQDAYYVEDETKLQKTKLHVQELSKAVIR